MNINQYMRQAIVKSVIADIPKPASTGIEERLQKIVDKAVAKQLPKEVVAVWKNKELRQWLTVVSIRANAVVGMEYTTFHVNVPSTEGRWNSNFRVTDPDLLAEFKRELAAADAELNAINEAQTKLTAAMGAIRTRKQFLATFPELAKYAPADTPKAAMLPAIANVVADLSKLGWPKDKTVAA
jgi:hypothetical protein